MAEKQHPFVEHKSASQEEQWTSVLQDENQRRITNGIYDPEVDENLIPMLKISALKRSQPQSSAQQPPPVLHASEKELPVELSAYPPAPVAQQPDTPVTIVDDYDFSEIYVYIVDII